MWSISEKVKFFSVVLIPFTIHLLPYASAFESVKYRDLIDKQRHALLDEVDPIELKIHAPDVSELFIDQPLDHFEAVSKNLKNVVVKQRYFYTSRYVIKSEDVGVLVKNLLRQKWQERAQKRSAYAFLCVGGEGPALDKSVLVDSVHCTGDMLETARKLNENGASVHMFALEHRYYGSSFPDIENPHGNENFKYLSSKQALADLSKFVKRMNKKHNLSGIKWVTFGGSYPGMMSAWARLKFPHLIHASISNSSPVQPVVDFQKYNDHQALAFQDPTVGGSAECLRVLSEGHAQTAKLLREGSSEKDLKKVADTFNVCNGTTQLQDKRNRDFFIGDGLFQSVVQSNDPSCREELCNIEKICKSLLEKNKMSAMERVAKISKTLTKQDKKQCTLVGWSEDMELLTFNRSTKEKLDWESWKSWPWQTCTEFGFFQTCETGTRCPFGQGFHKVDQDLKMCHDVFGIDEESVYKSVKESLDYYGGWDLNATRIMFVNGKIDPWSEMSVTEDYASGDQTALWVEGASHHFWTHKVKDSDSDEIVSIRGKIYDQVVKWISEDADNTVDLIST